MTEQEYEDTLKRGQGPPETKEDKKLRKKYAETYTEEHSLSNQASDRATKGLSISSVRNYGIDQSHNINISGITTHGCHKNGTRWWPLCETTNKQEHIEWKTYSG